MFKDWVDEATEEDLKELEEHLKKHLD